MDLVRVADSNCVRLEGLPYGEQLTELRHWNDTHCVPPLPDNDVIRALDCAVKFTGEHSYNKSNNFMAKRAENPFKTIRDFVDYLKRNHTFKWRNDHLCMENGDSAEQFVLNKMAVCLPYMSPKVIVKAVRWLNKAIPKTKSKQVENESVRTVTKTLDIRVKLENNIMMYNGHNCTIQYDPDVILINNHVKKPLDNPYSIWSPHYIIQISYSGLSNISCPPSFLFSRPISCYLI